MGAGLPRVGRQKVNGIARAKKQARVLTPDELQLLWSELSRPYDSLTKLAYLTASRISEVLALTAQHIYWSRNELHVPQSKVGATKTVGFTAAMRTLLKGLPSQGYLFPSPARPEQHVSRIAVHKALKKAAELCDLQGTSTHSFRRSMATHLYREGLDFHAIARLTGHQSIDNLRIYLDVRAEDVRLAQTALLDKHFGGKI